MLYDYHDVDQFPALARVSAYARSVLDGSEVAGPHVRNACRRHFDDLEKGHERGLFFDDQAAQHIMDFFEEELKLSDGQFEGIPFKLHPSQAFKLGSLFGWMKAPSYTEDGTDWEFDFDYYHGTFVPTRRFRRYYGEEGKGNGKSPFAGGIGLYGMTADGEAGAQIFSAAANKEQSSILFKDAVKMVRQSPSLSAALEISGAMGKEYNIAHLASMSSFKPMSKEAGKSGSGLRPHIALCDEVHEHPDRSVMEMLERGFKARMNPLLFMITNSGSDRTSVCWEEHVRACQVAAGTKVPDDNFTYVGEPLDDTLFAYVCALDKDDDPLTDKECWKKANPLLGVILAHSYIAGVVKQAVDMPGKRNGILRLHFCVWTDSDEAWMGRELIESCMEEFDPLEEHKGKPVALAVDLSRSQDMTAIANIVHTGFKDVPTLDPHGNETGDTRSLPTYDLWVDCFTPKDTIQAREDRDGQPYTVWADDPKTFLTALPGNRIRNDHLAAFVHKTDKEMKIVGMAYDRYGFEDFKRELDLIGLTFETAPHPQGGKGRAKPSQEKIDECKRMNMEPPQGLWMPGSVKAFENAILDGRIRMRKCFVLMTALMGAVFDRDPHDNKWFVKGKATVRIDAAVAAAMAVGYIEDAGVIRKPKKYSIMIV